MFSHSFTKKEKANAVLKFLRKSTKSPTEIKPESPSWHFGIHQANFIRRQALKQCLELCARMWKPACDLTVKWS